MRQDVTPTLFIRAETRASRSCLSSGPATYKKRDNRRQIYGFIFLWVLIHLSMHEQKREKSTESRRAATSLGTHKETGEGRRDSNRWRDPHALERRQTERHSSRMERRDSRRPVNNPLQNQRIETQTDRARDRDRERQRGRGREKETERERQRGRDREKETERERQTGRGREGETERGKETQRDRSYLHHLVRAALGVEDKRNGTGEETARPPQCVHSPPSPCGAAPASGDGEEQQQHLSPLRYQLPHQQQETQQQLRGLLQQQQQWDTEQPQHHPQMLSHAVPVAGVSPSLLV